ncbi:MAG: hypothetical protein QOJ07_3936 [Thermoleophilaceae bacterium]|nr:hypothetical protein [Thermoleophilaceae bacterium]
MQGAVAPEEQLEWEARAARPAALAAIAAALLVFAGAMVYPAAFVGAAPHTVGKTLMQVHDRQADLYVPAILQALGYLLLPIPLIYLYRATKARRDQLMQAARWVAIGGPILTAVAFVAHQIAVGSAASDFAKSPGTLDLHASALGLGGAAGPVLSSEVHANKLITDAANTPVLASLQYAGGLALAFAFVLISLNAMRAGLLSRFMGIMGIIVAVLTIVPALGPLTPVISVFWVGALGVLLLDRWPGGRGPAWEAVEERPWPGGAERRQAMLREKGLLDDEPANEADDDDYEDDDEPGVIVSSSNGQQTHSRSKKRKRKRRR